MLACSTCPFFIDCKVETKMAEIPKNIKPFSVFATPKNEADCPLKRAVETVNRQLDRINSLGIDK